MGQASGKLLVPAAKKSAPAGAGDAPPDFREVFDAHYGYICASLRRLGVRDEEREDAAIEVFLRVHARLERYDRHRPMRPWLFAFAARVASEFRRSARRAPPLALGRETADLPAPPEASDLDATDARGLVLAALDTLDDDKREVLVLHDLDDCSVPVIAEALDLPEGTVYTRLRAARARFAQAVRRLRASPRGARPPPRQRTP